MYLPGYRSLQIWIVTSLTLFSLVGPPVAAETLYNGIVLPEDFPLSAEEGGRAKGKPMPVPYLDNPPTVIPIDVGRQLFVDDFLIDSTTLTRTYYTAEYHPDNPILKPDQDWEFAKDKWFAAPFSGGTWYDSKESLFKMWYTAGAFWHGALATSADGIHWDKPTYGVVKGTNIVLPAGERVDNGKHLDTYTVWLDHAEPDYNKRYKYFATEFGHQNQKGIRLAYRTSADGIHWSNATGAQNNLIAADRTTVFYNPFRKVWVLSQKCGKCRGDASLCAHSPGEQHRSRHYIENTDPKKLIEVNPSNEERGVYWVGADHLDPEHPDPKFREARQLYNFDVTPYESLMLGMFSIWQGPPNKEAEELGLQKRSDILLGFSRDGFHFSRPDRRRFISCTWDEKSWRFGNVQSSIGSPLVVGDKLYFYFSGRAKASAGMYNRAGKNSNSWSGGVATGLAIIRRDGFASMDAKAGGGTLTTRPVTFKGKYLFVNVNCPGGELKAEVLDENNNVIGPYTLANCTPVSSDSTLVALTWKDNLSALSGQTVRFRFHLTKGSLYAFWVSPAQSGASFGYAGGGGPGFFGARDTIGSPSAFIKSQPNLKR